MSGYSISQALRTDKIIPGLAINAYSAKDLYADFATCTNGIPSEPTGVPDNEYQYEAYNNLCDRSAFAYSYDLDTANRPALAVSGMRAPALIGQVIQPQLASDNALFGGANPGTEASQGLTGRVMVSAGQNPSNYQNFLASFVSDKARGPVYVHKINQ